MKSNLENKIKKIVRETFQSFYFNRILKEDYSDLLKTIPPAKARELDMLYNYWMTKKNFQLNELNSEYANFILSKAVEEYKQTKDKKIHDKISYLFYPSKGSGIDNIMLSNKISSKNLGSGLTKNLKSRFGENWRNGLEEIVLNAWTLTIANENFFNRIINLYDPKNFKNLFLTILQLETVRLSSKSATIKRGGNAEFYDIDSAENIEYNEPEKDEFEIDSVDINSFKNMLKAFADEAKNISKFKDMHKYILDGIFKYGKSYEEMLKERPDLFPGKTLSNMSTIALNSVLLNKSVQDIAKNIGPEFGFPSDWLVQLINSKNINRIKVFLKSNKPSYRDQTPYKKEMDPYTKEKEDLVYEKKKQNP